MALPRTSPPPQGSRDDASIVPYRGLRYRRKCGSPVGTGPSVDRRGGIYPARGRLRRRGVRRGEAPPPYGRPGGCACPVWPETPNLFVGAGFIPPGVFVPPRASPGAQCAPLHGVHGGVGFAVNRGGFPPARRGGFHIRPQVFAAPRFPGWPPCFPCSVGRAISPAAPLQIQKACSDVF